MDLRRLTAWLLLLLPGCGPKQKTSGWNGDITAAVWSEVCPGSDPLQTWIRLHPDGRFDFAYNSPAPENWEKGDDESWTLEGDTLTVSWNGGYAVSRYAVDRAEGGVIPGDSSKSCGDQIRLELVP